MAEKLQINSANVHGEPGTGFEKRGNLGEECCGNCEYFKVLDAKAAKYARAGSCGQTDMVKLSKQPLTKDGRREMDDSDCCEYVHRVGRLEYGGKPKNLLKEPIR